MHLTGAWLIYFVYWGIIAARMQRSTLKIGFTIIITTLVLVSCQPETPITYPSGGYDYPSMDSVVDTSFYCYPLRNVFPRRDSFEISTSYLYYQTFDEPNLSVAPKREDIFRFTFAGFKFLPVIVTFTRNEMIIKTGSIGNMTYGIIDENRLNEAEKKNFRFIDRRYPYNGTNEHDIRYRTHYVDSMLKSNPQLLSLAYYKYLYNKATVPNSRHLHGYTTRRIKLSYGKFKNLVSIINDSGYWKLPYSLPEVSESSDGYGFSLEANTKSQYNLVMSNCDSDPKNKFFSICRAIVKCAGLEKQIDVFSPPTNPQKQPKIFIQDVQIADVKEDSSSPSQKHTHKK